MQKATLFLKSKVGVHHQQQWVERVGWEYQGKNIFFLKPIILDASIIIQSFWTTFDILILII